MRKHKIPLKKYADMHDEVQLDTIMNTKDGTQVTITVRSHIPYKEKIAFAQEMAENVIMVHDDSCCYMNYTKRAWELFLIAKYYTDVNTDGAEPEEVADFLINTGFIDRIKEVIGSDLLEVYDLFYSMYDAFEITYNDDRSLAKAVRTSFGFLFNGEDITESLAKAEATKDVMYKALSAIHEKEQEDATKISDGKLKVAGNLINFSRKQE